MHKTTQTVLFCLVLASAGSLFADSTAISSDRVRAHLDFLADDLLEGRETGTPGYEIAAKYVASEFQQIGLEPGGTDGFLQRIEFVRTSNSETAPGVVLQMDDEMVTLEHKEDFLASHYPFAASVQVSAPLVFVGFGIDAPDDGVDSFGNVDVDGKIAVLLSGAPSSLPSERRAHYSSRATKNRELIARGAVGAMQIRTLTDRKRYSWDRVLQFADRPNMVWRNDEQFPDSIAPSYKARIVLSPTGAEKVLALAGADVEQVLAEAEEGVPASFNMPGVSLSFAAESQQQVVTSPNVAGILRGSDPDLADQYVVYSAHLDHIGRGREIDGDDISNGYYDNAMGISIMLEVARSLAEVPQRPARSILFLAVTGEESGLLGSQYFAEFPTVPTESMIANVNVDMPLLMYPLADMVAFGAEHSSLKQILEEAATATGLTLSPDPMPQEVLFVRSDQYSFVRKGVPAVYLKPGFQSSDPEIDGEAIQTQFRKQNYHKPSDQIGLAVDFGAVTTFAQVNALIGQMIANAPDKPTWNQGNFFGELFGREPAPATPVN